MTTPTFRATSSVIKVFDTKFDIFDHFSKIGVHESDFQADKPMKIQYFDVSPNQNGGYYDISNFGLILNYEMIANKHVDRRCGE